MRQKPGASRNGDAPGRATSRSRRRIQSRQYSPKGRTHRREILFGQMVREISLNPSSMERCHLSQSCVTTRGERDDDASCIVRAAFAPDKTRTFHTVDTARQSASGQHQIGEQIMHAHPPSRGEAELHQDVEPVQRKSLTGLHFDLQALHEACVSPEKEPPHL